MSAEPTPSQPTATAALSATVILVHGAWHGAWCWAAQQSDLDQRGIASLAVDLPGHGVSTNELTDLHGDAAHLTAVMDRLAADGHGPVVLVGHSYGGAVITHAAAGRNDIAHLVYVAAFALDDGESVLGLLGTLDRHDVELGAAMVPTHDGLATTLEPTAAARALYNECPQPAAAASLQRLSAQPTATMTQAVSGSPRDSITSTYVVCTRDRAVHPEHQAVMAERCTQRIDIDTDHSPFVSAVDQLGPILASIAVEAVSQ